METTMPRASRSKIPSLARDPGHWFLQLTRLAAAVAGLPFRGGGSAGLFVSRCGHFVSNDPLLLKTLDWEADERQRPVAAVPERHELLASAFGRKPRTCRATRYALLQAGGLGSSHKEVPV